MCASDNLCLPKIQGDIGLRRMHDHNQALLAKNAWSLAHVQSPRLEFLGANYLWDESILHHSPPRISLYFWKGACFV